MKYFAWLYILIIKNSLKKKPDLLKKPRRSPGGILENLLEDVIPDSLKKVFL